MMPDATFIFADDAECYAYIYAYEDRAYVHIDVRKFSKSLLRKLLIEMWPHALEKLRSIGVQNFYAYPEKDDCKLFEKFVSRFGFKRFGMFNNEAVYRYG